MGLFLWPLKRNTLRIFKDTCDRSSVESGSNPVSRRNQRRRLGENRGEVKTYEAAGQKSHEKQCVFMVFCCLCGKNERLSKASKGKILWLYLR